MKTYLTYTEAKEAVKKLGISSYVWWDYSKNKLLPPGVPSNPLRIYRSEWTNWKDFLGTHGRKRVMPISASYLNFEEAMKAVLDLNVKNSIEWYRLVKSGKKPKNLPSRPDMFYTEWKGWRRFLQREDEKND